MIINSYYGDIHVNPRRQTTMFSMIPRRCTLSGDLLFMRRAIRVEHISIYGDMSIHRQYFYFKPDDWLELLLKDATLYAN